MDTIVVIILLCATSAAFAASTSCINCDGNNVTCVDGMCLPRCVNVTSSGECLQCRDSRFYGKQCEHDCPDTCLNSRCQMDNGRVVCTEGCVAGKKGDNCGVNCPTACTQCERYGDGCTGPCRNPRYYGPHCRTPCSSSCTDGCNRITGECGSCEPGYRGKYCDICNISEASCFLKPCRTCDGNNETCVDDVCLPRCVSVTTTGQCFQCRDSTLYGEHCEYDCPDTCLNLRCRTHNTRVVCTEGCVAGKKGDNCGFNCPPACTQCERYGDGCTGPCQNPRYYGPHCRTPCSSSCTDGCNRITGECDSCEPGYTGEKCDVTCPPNCRGGCDKDTGECDSCEPGYTGDKCDVTCPPNCRGGCDKDTGECGSCEPGYMGTYCNVTCAPKCNECHRDTGECDKCAKGFCRGGCDEHGDHCNSTSCKTTCRANCKVDDFTHNQCTEACINENYYGKICTTPCPDNCDTCEKDSAKCFKCATGLRGDLCNESCPPNCIACDRSDDTCMGACRDDNYHGPNCSTPCPVSCEGCDKETGRCINCGKGFSRTYCDEMCSPCTGDTCQRLPCKTRSTDHSLVISIGSVAGVLCCAVLILIFKRHITQLQCADRSSRNCSDTVGHRYWEIDVNLVAEQSEQTEQSAPAVPLTERPRERLAGRNPSGSQLTDESPSQAHWPKQAGDIFAGSEPQPVDSTRGSGVEKESLLTLLCASALAEADSDSRRQSVHSEGDIGINISGEIQRMTERTDSIIFLEENCDLSSVSVRYLTTNSTH